MAGSFSLSHDQYHTMAAETLKSLVTDEDFTDVTLACQDGQYIKAHKIILASSSSVFQAIITGVKSQQNPVIYLKGVQYEELRSIVNFIYLGETQVKQECFIGFMDIAQEFYIKGLASQLELQNNIIESSNESLNVTDDDVDEVEEVCVDDEDIVYDCDIVGGDGRETDDVGDIRKTEGAGDGRKTENLGDIRETEYVGDIEETVPEEQVGDCSGAENYSLDLNHNDGRIVLKLKKQYMY